MLIVSVVVGFAACASPPLQLQNEREIIFVERFKTQFPDLANDRDVLNAALMGYRAAVRSGGHAAPMTQCMSMDLGGGIYTMDCL